MARGASKARDDMAMAIGSSVQLRTATLLAVTVPIERRSARSAASLCALVASNATVTTCSSACAELMNAGDRLSSSDSLEPILIWNSSSTFGAERTGAVVGGLPEGPLLGAGAVASAASSSSSSATACSLLTWSPMCQGSSTGSHSPARDEGGHQRPSEAISGHQRPSEAIRSEAIRGNEPMC